METGYAYQCEKGCGHTTTIDKYYKGKRVFCGVCGTKDTMVYQGERQMHPIVKEQTTSFFKQAHVAAKLATTHVPKHNPYANRPSKPEDNPFG